LQDPVTAATPYTPGDKQFLLGYTDGVLTFNWAMYYDNNPGIRRVTVAEFVRDINKFTSSTGWSATDLIPKLLPTPSTPTVNASWFRNSTDRSALFFHAEGLQVGGGSVTTFLDRSAPDAGTTITLQPVMATVHLYPGCGDLTNAGAYSSSTSVTFRQLLGSDAAGFVSNPSGDAGTPGSAGTVDLRLLSPDQSRGTGTAQSPSGFYATGTPFGRGGTGATGYRPGNQGASHVVRLAGSSPVQQVIADTKQRQRLHVRFFGSGKKSKGRNVASLAHPSAGWFGRASVLSSGTALQWRKTQDGALNRASDIAAPVTVHVAGEGETITNPSVVLDYAHPTERIITLFQLNAGNATNVYETTSTDDGATWEEPVMAFAGGQLPDVARAKDGSGALLRSAYLPAADSDTGTLQGTFQNPGDAAPSAAITFKDADGNPLTVKPTGHTITQLQEGRARWALSCTIAGESEISDWHSSEDGKTWTRFS